MCLESRERHRRAVRTALQGAPRVLCLDFTGARLLGSDGVRLLCEAAVCCDYLDVELRVLESAAVKRTLDVVGLPGYDEWLAHAYLQAAHRPTRMSGFAFGCALPAMTADQLESARSACSSPHHAADGSTRQHVSRSRMRATMRVQRRGRHARRMPDATTSWPPLLAGVDPGLASERLPAVCMGLPVVMDDGTRTYHASGSSRIAATWSCRYAERAHSGAFGPARTFRALRC